MKFIFLFFLTLFIHCNLFSQELLLKDQNNQPIEGVQVYPSHATFTLLSNRNGKVALEQFSQKDTICFRHIQFKSICYSYQELREQKFIVSLQEAVISLQEVVSSAQKWEQNKEHISQQAVKITPKEIGFNNPQTSADLLGMTGQVFIQKSQMGGGSPMIRGFAANRVLLVIDGVRMNNAIYRSGNLQNIISVDANSLESAEVVFGPGSVLYGSDALGGVMNFQTQKAELSLNSKVTSNGQGMARYSSANNEKTTHFDVNVGIKKFAWLTSFTFSDFDDLRSGNNRPSEYPDYGKRLEYIERVNGEDSVLRNKDENLQRFSGYSQWNLLQKFRYQFNDNTEAIYSFHLTSSSNVPRYDRLIEYSNGDLRSAEWYYGPQNWMMHHLQLNLKPMTRWADQLRITGAWQQVEESRNDRRLGSATLRSRTENVEIYTLNLDAEKSYKEGKSRIFYGAEIAYNTVKSTGETLNIITNEKGETSSRYPSGGSELTTTSAYLSHQWLFLPKLTMNSGVRYSAIFLTSNFTDKQFFEFPFDKAELNTGALNGSIGLTYRSAPSTQLNINLSTGFRSPNVDDIGKIFDSEPGAVVVPNPDLKPEYAWNAEFGISQLFGEKVKLEFTTWYTLLTDALVRRKFQFNAQDSIVYDGVLSQVEAVTNTGRAITTGVSTKVKVSITENLTLQSAITWTYGRDLEDNLPLQHVPPVFGETVLVWKKQRWQMQGKAVYQGWKRWEDLAPSEQAKVFIYTEDGTPAWYTLNLKGSYRPTNNITLQVGIENILDVHYRPYSSGISAPGRNLIFSVRGYF